MRILQVSHGFPPDARGGAERYAWLLTRALCGEHEVGVFTRVCDTRLREYEVVESLEDEYRQWKVNNCYSNVSSFEDTYRNERIGEAFQEVLTTWRPQIVHFHHLTNLSTTLPAECARAGVPSVLTLHDYWLLCQRGQLVNDRLECCPGPSALRCARCLRDQLTPPGSGLLGLSGRRRIRERERHIRDSLSHIGAFVAPSRYLARRFERAGVAKGRIEYFDYGFDDGILDWNKKPSENLRFGFVGSLMVTKGADVAIRAFREVEGEHLRLVLHGGYQPYHEHEGYLDQVRALASGDSRIRFAGEYDYAAIGEVFSTIDVLIFPSIWIENSPLTIHEAYLTGTPVVASDHGALPGLVTSGNGGLLFRAGDPSSLATRIRKIRDEPQWLEFARRSLPKVKSIEENMGEMVELYGRLMSDSSDSVGFRPSPA